MDIPQDELKDFITGMQSIVRMPLESVMQMLCVVNYILNDEKLELKDISIYDAEQQLLRKELVSQSMERQPVTETNSVYFQLEPHNTLAIEKTIENIIRKGDTTVLKEWIATEAIAKHLYLSRPYLSAKFKKETGMSLTDFILKEKTGEAKRLLCYSEKSLLNISNYLGFSSQGHFSRVFKKNSDYAPVNIGISMQDNASIVQMRLHACKRKE